MYHYEKFIESKRSELVRPIRWVVKRSRGRFFFNSMGEGIVHDLLDDRVKFVIKNILYPELPLVVLHNKGLLS